MRVHALHTSVPENNFINFRQNKSPSTSVGGTEARAIGGQQRREYEWDVESVPCTTSFIFITISYNRYLSIGYNYLSTL